MAESVGFVGRDRELSVLLRTIEERSRLLLVVGDAGVGKTRLVGEATQRIVQRGALAAWGRCLPLADSLPLLPLVDAVGELCANASDAMESALSRVPRYAREEVERLVPRLAPDAGIVDSRAEPGGQERLFCGVAELLAEVAHRRPVILVVEDIQWADSGTLDCLTFLSSRPQAETGTTIVATSRSDESPLPPHVTDWLAYVRGNSGLAEIRLRPLTRTGVGQHLATLMAREPSPQLVDAFYARTEGNPFFLEQLVASAKDELLEDRLPARLAELLGARIRRCSDEGRAALAALAVAGRPLTERQLCSVTGLAANAVREGLRELADARLLADDKARGECRPRHALLAEAAIAELLPGERAKMHQRTAEVLEAVSDDTLEAEIAGHWAAAGDSQKELQARILGAEAAERLFAYAEAAAHWRRAVSLADALPHPLRPPGVTLSQMYIRAIDALEVSGDGRTARVLAEQAHRSLGDHVDPATAAVINTYAARVRPADEGESALILMEKALCLFELAPPSVQHAQALLGYASMLVSARGNLKASVAALKRAEAIAQAADAPAILSPIHTYRALHEFLSGQIERGFAALGDARKIAEIAHDDSELIRIAANESDALLRLGRFDSAIEVALRGTQIAAETGRLSSFAAKGAAANIAESLIAQGRTDEAAAIIDPLTSGLSDHYALQRCRAEIDLLLGHLEPATRRLEELRGVIDIGRVDLGNAAAAIAAEAALWSDQPDAALARVVVTLAPYQAPDLAILTGRLLVAGMRACADLAARARARLDTAGLQAAAEGAGTLATWVNKMEGVPFTDHRWIATTPAERATWEAEQSRLQGSGDVDAWYAAGVEWNNLGYQHRAAYAWWRHGEALLLESQSRRAAASALRRATIAGQGHVPLLAAISTLAQRAHLDEFATTHAAIEAKQARAKDRPYGLTNRELVVLRLLTSGRSNSEIGAELFISKKTASVHVTNILRKLGVANRIQAAALAERVGLLAR